MKRSICLIVTPVLFTSLLSGVATAAAPKSGSTCSKAGITAISNGTKYTCIKSGKKLIWDKGVKVVTPKPVLTSSPSTVETATPSSTPSTAPSPTPSQSPTPKETASATPSPSPSPSVKYYVAQDQTTVQSISSREACSNPAKASFEIQAQIDGTWLPVKLIESGYSASILCTDPALGLRNSLAFAKLYMDPGTTYRWLYSGEINFSGTRDAQGRVASTSFKMPPPIKYYVAKDPTAIQSFTSKDPCSNPNRAAFEIQALVDGEWLPVKLIESGFKISSGCTDPALGQRNSVAYAKFNMDPGTTYRWAFSGDINLRVDAQGFGYSAELKIIAPLPPASVPVTLPVAQTGKITFANAAANYTLIPQVAWQNVQDEIAANNVVTVATTIHIGPNTKASLSAINNGLIRIDKLFSGFNRVSSFTGIVYSAQDLKWAQTDAANFFQTLGIKGGFAQPEVIANQSSAGCEMNGQTAIDCGGGMAWDLRQNNSDAGGSYYGVQNGDYWTDSLKNSGPMTQVTHEATHNYQIIQFFHTPLGENQFTSSGQSHDFTPWWFSEGQANGIGISTFIENLSDYLSTRNYTVIRSPGTGVTLPTFTPEGMKSFLIDYQVTGPQNRNWMLAYSIGYSAVETLIAIGGARATMALYALGSNGENWETAFKHVYGISWDEAATVLGKVLAAQYAANPMQK